MKHSQLQRAAKLACPRFWAEFFQIFLGADAHLAMHVWKQLYPSEAQPLMYQLARLEDSGRHPDSTKRFGDLASPALLLKACERLSPSRTGRPRRKDVVQLEETILARCDGQGRWV